MRFSLHPKEAIDGQKRQRRDARTSDGSRREGEP
jgi:hypothetical protein